MRRDRERLVDILEAIRQLEPIRAKGKSEFDNDPLLRAAAQRQIEIIGEAVTQLPEDVTARQPRIPWEQIRGMRNRLAHAYWDVDDEVVWRTIEFDLDPLQA